MPFCTGCGAQIESGTKCQNCQSAPAYQSAPSYQSTPVYQTAGPAPGSELGLGNWLNEIWVSFKNLFVASQEENWLKELSPAAIWGTGAIACVLFALLIMLAASSANSFFMSLIGFNLIYFSGPKAFFLGLLAMAVSIAAIFGGFYLFMATGKSNISVWNLFGLSSFAHLFLAVILLMSFIGSKILPSLGILLVILGMTIFVQILSQELKKLSDISPANTFYATPATICIDLLLLYAYLRLWLNW